MSIENDVDIQVCEACGCAGEIGFIIKEGDEVAEVMVMAPNKIQLEAEFEKYLALAQQVSSNVEYEASPIEENSTELHARFKFEVSAEKLIFELKSRSLAR
ncbi:MULTISPECIES: YfcZ/YiiS family protein [Vibrio]|uniref:YfcZ/YiiS family protein n=1 Tax=Vibrio aestuarianus TaxID=28171 RepID=A0A7X6N761_9VIBR|nr:MULTISPECIES: YfcZ/YiiS family protein [Vibrio]KOE81512.1 hypothetical protein ACS86_12995 [Vibrio alginolyticus]MBD1566911.1 DUF406 family protein [Vibrio sp. S12_S33]MDE1209922.1 YfcZ/YiiS family protein [Vibrio aestuarianus]MDE1214605.1 YfcZ/YiiS family protein [Vibrio aestuarianus]MDE1218760.1 YfcZ/YiiS family protein [Vibrio aestuarianus]